MTFTLKYARYLGHYEMDFDSREEALAFAAISENNGDLSALEIRDEAGVVVWDKVDHLDELYALMAADDEDERERPK